MPSVDGVSGREAGRREQETHPGVREVASRQLRKRHVPHVAAPANNGNELKAVAHTSLRESLRGSCTLENARSAIGRYKRRLIAAQHPSESSGGKCGSL